jgi:starch synthase
MIRVLAAASEVFPLIKTGGLADVTGALPAALAPHGVEMRTLLPGYHGVMAALDKTEPVLANPDLFGGPAQVLAAKAAGLDLLVLDAPHLYGRTGNIYTGPDGRDWPDNPQRFGALCRVAADIGLGAIPGWAPDAVHCHDWQTGLVPAYLHYAGGARPRTVMTIHNLAFTGQVPLGLRAMLGLPEESLTMDGVEFYQAIGFMKAGLRFADAITTVSPTYALEIQTPALGCGYDGLLRSRRAVLHGILNGVDEAVWDPWTDPHLAAKYRRGHLRKRPHNKAALQALLGLDLAPDTLLLGIISRLTDQKGMDLVLRALPSLLALGAQLAVVGSGDRALEDGFRAAAAAHPGQVAASIGYNEGLAHQTQAGIDALLVPSRFEPCGLTQLCALRYGALPVVSRAGGLADTVIDANEAAIMAGVGTGIVFGPAEPYALEAGLQRTAALWADPKAWRAVQRNGMAAYVGWEHSARRYAALYFGTQSDPMLLDYSL